MVLEAVVEKLKLGFGRKQDVGSPAGFPQRLDDCLEEVVQWIVAKFGKEYFVEPLEEFAAKFGKSFPEDPFYQDRMNYFLEYCILERPLKGNAAGLTPHRAFMDEKALSTSSPGEAWSIFGEFRHSLFEVVRAGQEQIILKDLQNNQRYVVQPKSGETLRYLQKKTIFQGYIFGSFGVHYLGQGVIPHPEKARKTLMKFLKSGAKSSKLSEMEILKISALTNMRYLRMKHVDPAILYRQYLV